ncbi:2-octaprenyl-6-methoxy-1,4-benzoquinone methylase /demethylmenaquinone methyltransferase [Bartonella sp. CDC_skunk]|uniref:bifunctional demethylmenaquinone methyltransferase/2-methoxy-6-polyprenyl-1,4-benzoquinol methylase UbiE n=1 Tax=unclassified Bartonella TaxID=2645622 RepID=UPI0009997BCE|nr:MULTISPECIES: bifunctional demethylmenaquinone methyltransferase/2-methoxy-6-polyprenyl-1,4-benzoquinol methylase UbiE [unclassified Bartonella]AQX19068.1 2-octaprenyl-6-methoxy-1,4-benzoquinone methylase /demethylmenaquinone methyltransferase [Bartonella sp. A1379B]AQX20700.1 2-octaprenyl-6-methoxy-1,4-benzoquinone methylase /demethylmenaquinone methyltransferase [Bartonella sp. CDC_skunk]AQX22291.1 demethylmenaquinone methyltransferase / 2-methoxy-6-polyprenyl-1,4-benzoquinol methylase [Bar
MAAETERVGIEGGMEHFFGFKKVDEMQKQSMVDNVFHSVAENYDKMNDILSLGLHRIWKNSMVAWLSPPAISNWKALDVAGGTGDIAFRILNASRKKAHVTVLDINDSMLNVGKKRAQKNNLASLIDFIEANAELLPFEDQSFDAYTIAFGIRNVPHIDKALKEAFRVLKPGGRFLCLEFSNVEMPLLDKIYDLWSFHAIPKLGQFIAGDHDAYHYLIESIRKFPKQNDFAHIIKSAGFSSVSYRTLTGAIATLYSGWKI